MNALGRVFDLWVVQVPEVRVAREAVTPPEVFQRHAERLAALTARIERLDAEILTMAADERLRR